MGRIGKEMSYVIEVQLAWMHYLMLLRTPVWVGQTNPSMLSYLTIFNVTPSDQKNDLSGGYERPIKRPNLCSPLALRAGIERGLPG